MSVTSRTNLKDYCMRRLGWPVVQINIDDDQVDDRIDDALQFFQDYHFDATERVYISHKVSATDIAQRYIDMSQISGQANTIAGSNVVTGYSTNFVSELTAGYSQIKIGSETKTVSNVVDNRIVYTDSNFSTAYDGVPVINVTDADSIIGVYKIFSFGSSASVNMFDLRYQLRLHDLYDFTSTSYVNFVLTQQHLRTLEMLFTGENSIRFNRKQTRLYIDWKWDTSVNPGEFIIVEASKIVNPEAYTKIYDDRFLKHYTTALLKRQWGSNMKKFGGIQLPGGVMFSGQQLYDEAEAEILKLETEMQLRYEEPLEFFIG